MQACLEAAAGSVHTGAVPTQAQGAAVQAPQGQGQEAGFVRGEAQQQAMGDSQTLVRSEPQLLPLPPQQQQLGGLAGPGPGESWPFIYIYIIFLYIIPILPG